MSEYILSVIIPVYNAEAYLPRCLDSFLAANAEDVEVLLVDDGSKDGSVEAAEEYARRHPNIRILSQVNSGPSAARNRGIREAGGEYVTFADADDYVLSEAFADRVKLLKSYDADVWYSDFYRVNDGGKILDRVFQIEPSAEPQTGKEHIAQYLSDSECVWNVWRSFYKKSFLTENDLFFREDARIAEDLEFTVRVLCKTESPAFFHEPYYCYRVNYGSSLTRVFTAKRVEQFVSMVSAAFETLEREKPEFSPQMKNKLLREYVFNMAVCFETEKGERSRAFGEFERTAACLREGTSSLSRLANVMVSILGVRLTAYCLIVMKRSKQALRKIKN